MISRAAEGLGTQLRRLLELLDGDLEEIYRRDGHGYRPRFTPVMKALADGTARSIKEIAAQSSISHSAASQTVARMVAQGLLQQEVGQDARERLVRLTRKGRSLLPALRRRWAATEAAADGLDAELDVPLSRTLAAAIEALEARPFHQRIDAAAAAIEEKV